MADMVASLYPDLHPDLVPGAHINISNHLQKLEEEQIIRESLSLPSSSINETISAERDSGSGETKWTLTQSSPNL